MTDRKTSELYDVIIIGGGPAGLTAAIYLARARYRILVMEKEQFGGQITITSEVVNYPGIPRTDGRELTEAMRKQAAGFGAEFLKTTVEEILTEKLPEEELKEYSSEKQTGEISATQNGAKDEDLKLKNKAKDENLKLKNKAKDEDIKLKNGAEDEDLKLKNGTEAENLKLQNRAEDENLKPQNRAEDETLKPTDGTENHLWLIRTDRGEFRCFGLLAATGAHPRMIGFEGEEEFRSHGVAYCATCDGEFFTGKEIFVVGGGFAAAEESVFLTKYASHVTILVREPDFTCAKGTADAAKQHDKITVLVNTEVEAVTGDTAVTGIRYVNNVTGERTEYRASEGGSIGVFVFAGYEPATELFRGVLELDKQGYIVTDRNQRTNVDGIYAAGDVCVKNLRQVVTAVGDGATAATELEKYAAKMQKETGLVPTTKEVSNRGKNNRPDVRSADQKIHDAEKEEGDRWKDHSQGRNHGRNYEKAERTEAENRRGEENVSEADDGRGYAKWEETGGVSGSDSLFDEDTLAQLAEVFDRMEQDLILEIHPDDRSISLELEEYMNILAAMTEKLTVRTVKDRDRNGENLPYVRILRADGTDTGLAFHGVPGGHEFTPFILSLFNAAGPGQKIDGELEKRIAAIRRPAHMKIMVSLTCEVCPDLVAAAQRIAAGNPFVTAEVYDFAHFPQMSEEYHVLSVPCLIVNEDYATFGKKTMKQLLDILEMIA